MAADSTPRFWVLPRSTASANLNVSKFGPKLAGAGGFINISQNAKEVVFVGTFGAGKLRIAVADGRLKIVEEAKSRKFVEAVEHVTFSGAYATARGQHVLYVTERCVFALRPNGLELTEVAPGIDIERDILALMDFKPSIPRDPALMDARIFREGVMDLRNDLVDIPLPRRFTYDEQQNLFFINFERLALRTSADIKAIEKAVESRLPRWAVASTLSSITTIFRFHPSCSTNIRRWCDPSPTVSTRAFRATRHQASFASSSARRWRNAGLPRTSSKAPTRRSGTRKAVRANRRFSG